MRKDFVRFSAKICGMGRHHAWFDEHKQRVGKRNPLIMA
jgi:hypothetical protein